VPSQTPFVPQVVAPASLHLPCGSAALAATGVHIPAVVGEALHDMQVPVHAFAQQTPCWQKPELHSAAEPHMLPVALRPHTPPLQTAGDTQSALVAHGILHFVAPHT
jgi:hypothetical protein